jgi:hypothetical protein
MIDKPDPAKDGGRTDGPGAKRPHATLDLKATEVKPPPQAASAATAASASPYAEASKPSASGGAEAKSAATGRSSETPPQVAGTKPAETADEDIYDSEPRRGGGFISHLAAGIVGGGLVYAATAYLAPAPGPVPVPTKEATAQLEARVAALEHAPRDSENVNNLAAKVADAEARLQKLGEIEKNVAALRDSQGALDAQIKALGEASQKGDAAAVADRVGKLEEQLAMIASAAPRPDGGPPQLAAITGKIADVETSLGNQIAALRKSLPSEVEDRLNTTAESSEAAKAATSRLDRELAQVRTDQARASQNLEAGKADTARISAALDAMKEETGKLSSALGELRSSVDAQVKGLAKPADVSAAVTPVASKLAELQKNVDTVVNSEQTRKENAERIVLSLELANLKRALDRGQGYAAELAEVNKAAQGKLDLAALERFKDTGVATLPELKATFRPVMNAVIDADTEPADGSVFDRLLAGAKSVVRVRKISHEAGDESAEAVVSRIEEALADERLGDVIAQAKSLPAHAQAPIQDWLQKVSARHSVDIAIAAVENQLKASLSGTAPPVRPAEATQPAPAPPPPAGQSN